MARVIVTGASGLVGRETVCLLQDSGYRVIPLTRNTGALSGYTVTDYSVGSLTRLLRADDIVVHLAAQRGGTGVSYKEYQINAELTENVLQAMEKVGCQRLIFLSSISVYSKQDNLPWTELQTPEPAGFYGLSKLVSEGLCQIYSSRGICYTIFRCAHVLGIEDRGYMLGNFMKNAFHHENLIVKGKSIAKREFVYVKDVANAILWAIRTAVTQGELYNLGYGEGYTNYEVAEQVNSSFHNEGKLIYQSGCDEGITSSYMDVGKIVGAGFQPQFSFQSAMDDISSEYKRQKTRGNT